MIFAIITSISTIFQYLVSCCLKMYYPEIIVYNLHCVSPEFQHYGRGRNSSAIKEGRKAKEAKYFTKPSTSKPKVKEKGLCASTKSNSRVYFTVQHKV